jgi:transposase
VLSLPPTVRVFVVVEPVDMRGSFDALAGAVRRLGLDPVDGHLYLFLNVTDQPSRDDRARGPCHRAGAAVSRARP